MFVVLESGTEATVWLSWGGSSLRRKKKRQTLLMGHEDLGSAIAAVGPPESHFPSLVHECQDTGEVGCMASEGLLEL